MDLCLPYSVAPGHVVRRILAQASCLLCHLNITDQYRPFPPRCPSALIFHIYFVTFLHPNNNNWQKLGFALWHLGQDTVISWQFSVHKDIYTKAIVAAVVGRGDLMGLKWHHCYSEAAWSSFVFLPPLCVV